MARHIYSVEMDRTNLRVITQYQPQKPRVTESLMLQTAAIEVPHIPTSILMGLFRIIRDFESVISVLRLYLYRDEP